MKEDLYLKNRKFQDGDIAYEVRVYENLTVVVSKVLVTSAFFNSLPQYNKWLYSFHVISSEVIDDHRIPNTEDKTSNYIKGGTGELFFKDQVELEVGRAVEDRKVQNERNRIAADQFRCPITGGKILEGRSDLSVMDGPTTYKVEGHVITWETNPRDWDRNIYHSSQGSYKYLFEGNWQQVELIRGATGKCKYFPIDQLDSEEVLGFISKEEKREEENQRNRSKSEGFVFKTPIKRVHPQLVAFDKVSVSPLPKPSMDIMDLFAGPEREFVELKIDGDMVEVDVVDFKKWEAHRNKDGSYQLGNTIIIAL